MLYVILLACVLGFVPRLAHADVYGSASVTVGGDVQVAGQHVRLHGIHIPTPGRTCMANEVEWDCGREATDALTDRIGGKLIRCVEQGRDRIDRIIAVCYVNDININAWLVAEGWAFSNEGFSPDYQREERQARVSEKGIWRGGFRPPSSWRDALQHSPAENSAKGCSVCAQRRRSFSRSSPARKNKN